MKFAVPIVPFLLLAACAAGEEAQQERLMDEIEAKVILPKGSLPLAHYARYYTEYEGNIIGAYTTQIEERPANFGCSEIQADGSLRNVPCPAVADLRPGHRRWVQFSDYPAAAGEGCRAVHIIYNPVDRLFEYAECVIPDH